MNLDLDERIKPLLASAQQLPKCELHAHLNGSIRRSTLHELALAAGLDASAAHIVENDPRSLSDMFAVFGVIHRAVRGAEAVRRISREVLEDMEADGVMYAEIRTTPRAHPDHGLSKRDYVMAVLAGFDDYSQATSPDSQVEARLILSLDRRDEPAEHLDTVHLALNLVSSGMTQLVGIDLSGDPAKGTWADWEPALTKARQGGLKVTVHAGELDGKVKSDEEMHEVLRFCPDRLGHVCFISEDNLAQLRRLEIPLELCLTSNVLSNSVPSYQDHHFRIHHRRSTVTATEKGCAVTLCTDDSAVFGSPLSREYAIAASTFDLSDADLEVLALNGIEAAFVSSSEKSRLQARFRSALHRAAV